MDFSWVPAISGILGGLFGGNSAERAQGDILKQQRNMMRQYLPYLLQAYQGMATNPQADSAYNLTMREMQRFLSNRAGGILDQDIMGLERRGMIDSSMLPSMAAYRQAQGQGALARGSYDWLTNARRLGLSGLSSTLGLGGNLATGMAEQYGQQAQQNQVDWASMISAIAKAASAASNRVPNQRTTPNPVPQAAPQGTIYDPWPYYGGSPTYRL